MLRRCPCQERGRRRLPPVPAAARRAAPGRRRPPRRSRSTCSTRCSPTGNRDPSRPSPAITVGSARHPDREAVPHAAAAVGQGSGRGADHHRDRAGRQRDDPLPAGPRQRALAARPAGQARRGHARLRPQPAPTTQVPKIAVFCDGGAGTARPSATASPTTRTSAPRCATTDYLVWAVTHRDLDAFATRARRQAGPTTVVARRSDCACRSSRWRSRVAAPGSVKADVLLTDAVVAADRVPAPAAPGRRGRAPRHALGLALCHRADAHKIGQTSVAACCAPSSATEVDGARRVRRQSWRAGARAAPSSRSSGGRCRTCALGRGGRPGRGRRHRRRRSRRGTTGWRWPTCCSSSNRAASTR